MRKPPSDCRTASLYKGEILCLPYRGTSDFIRLLFFSEKPPVLQFCAYGFPLPVAHSTFDALLEILQKHNQKNKEFYKSIEQAQAKIEYHHISEFSDEIDSFEKTIYSEEGAAVEVIRPVYRQVNYYEMSASAGLGNFLGSDFAETKMEVTNPECTFAVKISGDSMEPNIHDQDIALVKQCEVIPNAHIGIVNYKGVCYCKKIVQKSSGILLVSLNKNYPPITVSELDEYHLFGEVIEIIHHSDGI